jgi:3-dehydro-L-gulonate 2-dehydrogenase
MQSGAIRIPFSQLEKDLARILVKYGFDARRADQCAHVFASNTLDGVYSHGIERFPRFIRHVVDGYVKPDAEPSCKNRAGAIEQWDGCLGAGILNALISTERAIELSAEFGLGCVALSNTNHWMRGGYYGWKVAKAGFIFIGWTNTVANMPAWGAVDCRLGNNPLVIGVPYGNEAIVLDMAMSQFSYGRMERHSRFGDPLPVPGGFDKQGSLTTDPAAILKSGRLLPMGYWKGSGLALLLDILATLLSGGLSTAKISRLEAEHAQSQVFFCIDISHLGSHQQIQQAVHEIIENLKASTSHRTSDPVLYPGENVLNARKEHLASGIPVQESFWNEIQRL